MTKETTYQDLPSLLFRKSERVGDFTTSEVIIESKGLTFAQTKEGFNLLLSSYKELEKKEVIKDEKERMFQ